MVSCQPTARRGRLHEGSPIGLVVSPHQYSLRKDCVPVLRQVCRSGTSQFQPPWKTLGNKVSANPVLALLQPLPANPPPPSTPPKGSRGHARSKTVACHCSRVLSQSRPGLW